MPRSGACIYGEGFHKNVARAEIEMIPEDKGVSVDHVIYEERRGVTLIKLGIVVSVQCRCLSCNIEQKEVYLNTS